MIRFARDFRLIPIVLVATVCLFALKVSGLVFDGGYTLAERMENHTKPQLKIAPAESVPQYPKIVVAGDPADQSEPGAKESWAQQMFNFGAAGRDVTGSVDKQAKSSEEKPKRHDVKVASKPPAPPKLEAGGTVIPIVPGQINSPGERAILESLQKRRQELDARARDLDMRENLLKAAEQRVQAKVDELKQVETSVKSEVGNRDAAQAKHFKGLITMYENMKPKDAARIFDRLDMSILVEVSTQMKPRAMSAILAEMSSQAAERLTVELANRASGRKTEKAESKELPKIEGKPSGG
jgi:flagellar motility protein MotE (MotC chaperone)